MLKIEKIAIDDFKEKFVFVKIHNVLQKEDYSNEAAIYASTVGFWKLDIEKCKKSDYVIALLYGKVAGIYHVNGSSWYNHEKELFALNEYSRKYRSKDIDAYFNKGTGRVFFSNCDDKIEPELEYLLGKEIYYKNDMNYLKTQNVHYSKNMF